MRINEPPAVSNVATASFTVMVGSSTVSRACRISRTGVVSSYSGACASATNTMPA